MKYITVQEAAAKWKISERSVRAYCAGGKVEGARKTGRIWRIPDCAGRPGRQGHGGKKEKGPGETLFQGLMPLMNTPFLPGHCMKTVEAMEDGPEKNIASAEYYYFSGQPEKAVREAGRHLNCPDPAIRLSACLIYGYASLSMGEIAKAKSVLGELKKALATEKEESPYIQAAEEFLAATAATLLHLPFKQDLSSMSRNLSVLPEGIRLFALYVQAHYYYLQEEYGKSIGLVEASLALASELYPIPAIYLHLVAVMDYMSLRQTEQAKKHLLTAWEIARPDDLIEGFGEHHGLLGGMLESVIKKEWPDDFKRIIAITYRFSAGWRRIHNPDTGHDVADNLTTTEFATAMLAARGWTNHEIAEHLHVSVNTVKGCVSTVLQKLNIRQRQELKKYMLR